MIVANRTTGQRRGSRITPAVAEPRAASSDDVIDANRTTWLRDAEAALTVLDWRAFTGGRTLHVLDFAEIGAPKLGFLGFTTGAQLHELAADFIPKQTFRRGAAAAVAVNVDRIARTVPAVSVGTAGDAVGVIRAAVATVAAHELSHVLDAEAEGRRLPPGSTLDQAIQSLTDGRAVESTHRVKSHSPGWLRAFAHLTTRAASLPHFETWLASFIRDVGNSLPHSGEAYLDALHPELARFTSDDRLVDVLRTPAPAGFLSLFETAPATEEK